MGLIQKTNHQKKNMKNDCLSCPSHLVLVELARKKLSRALITISTTFLEMVLDAIRNAQFDDDGRRKYRDFIKQVANPAGRKKNESIVMMDLLLENLFQDDGNIPDSDKIFYQLAILQSMLNKGEGHN
jgi:hypothetical protein